MKLFTDAIRLNFILFESVKTLISIPLMSNKSYSTSSEARRFSDSKIGTKKIFLSSQKGTLYCICKKM